MNLPYKHDNNIQLIHIGSLYVVAKLGVADHILNDSVDYKQLAARVKADPEKLYRIIRYLTTEGYFTLSDDGKVSLTDSGQYLRSDREDSMRYCMICWGEEVSYSFHNLLAEVKGEGEAFELTYGKVLFSLYEERPESAEAFTKCMRGVLAIGNAATASEYDFSQHHTLLDLGGGMGSATEVILTLHDKSVNHDSTLTKAIIFDLEKIIKHAIKDHDIIQYRSGSFFNVSSIPTGADVILINNVIHDWNDEECIEILNNAAKVLKSNGSIVIADCAVPKKDDPLFYSMTRFDVIMMSATSGIYRTFDDYEKLFLKTASLKLKEIRPTRSPNSLFILQLK